MLTNICFCLLKVTNIQNVLDQHQCIANKPHLFCVVNVYLLLEHHIPHFLNTYPILYYNSKPFFVLFPLSVCPSPIYHLANSSGAHLQCQLNYEPCPDPPCIFSSLATTSHSKHSVAPSSAPLAPCIGLIIFYVVIIGYLPC